MTAGRFDLGERYWPGWRQYFELEIYSGFDGVYTAMEDIGVRVVEHVETPERRDLQV